MDCGESTHAQMPTFDASLLPIRPDLSFEMRLWQAGNLGVAGIDEAGRGALAGPVAAAAVVLPMKENIAELLEGVCDSKQMSPHERDMAGEKIIRYAEGWGVGLASAEEIDQMGIVPATRMAAWRALDKLPIPPDHLLLDYLFLPDVPIPQTSLIKGDCRSLSIAAASVLAKISRDALMRELELTYPGYGFAAHKGYGTRVHREALRHLGPCLIHRNSFTLLAEPGISSD